MVKEFIWQKIKEYNILQFLILALILHWADNLLCSSLFNQNSISSYQQLDQHSYLGIHLLFVFLWSCAVFFILRQKRYFLITNRNYLKDHLKYKRSYFELTDYYKDADICRLDTDQLPCMEWQDTDGVILGKKSGKTICRSSSSPGNIAVYGLPGDGKTAAIIIPTALRFAGSVMAIDIKGDIYAATRQKRKIKLFAPSRPDISCHYNPLQGIKNLTADQRRIFTENISLILISDAPGDGKYFADGARDYFNGISLFLLSDNPDITFPEIVREILLGNGIDWVKKIVGSNCLEAKEFLASYWGQNEKNIAGCYGVLSQAVRPFSSDIMSDLLDGCGNCISPKSLEDGYDVYLQIEQSELAVYSPLLTIMTQQFLNSFLNRKPSTGMKLRPIIFLLDEFPQLHFNLKTLSTALSTLRSRAVTLLLCQQSLSQLDKLYGEAGRKEIMDTCAYYGILSVQDVQTREYFSKLIGTHKVLRISNNLEDSTQKTGRSVQEAREPIFQPEEFGSLGNYLVIYANGKYIKAEKTFYFR